MSEQAKQARLERLLFPPEEAPVHPPRRLFAVLDGARDPSVHIRVRESGRPFACLYRGELPAPLAEVAPYLVELASGDDWSRLLLADAWGESWGIFVDTRVELAPLMRHLRGFLKVRDDGGRQLVFRYYDPRVFRLYLPTANATEANSLTGPVRAYYMESEDGSELLAFRPRSDGFTCETLPLQAGVKPEGGTPSRLSAAGARHDSVSKA